MGFKKGNNHGKKAIPISETEKKEIVYHIEEYSIGYTLIKGIWGYSQTKLNKNGIYTLNEKSVKKAEKQLNRVDFEEIRDIWTCQIDGSDITEKSLRDANKSKRVITWNCPIFDFIRENGLKMPKKEPTLQVKMYGLATRSGFKDILFKVQLSSGETKKGYSELINRNLDKIGKHVILDSQSKFNEAKELGINFYHPKKTVKHPHNSEVEAIFSLIKNLIHKNSKELKTLPITHALDKIKNMSKIALTHDKALTIEEINEIEETQILHADQIHVLKVKN